MTRVAYVAPFGDERGTTCARFLLDAAVFFARHGVRTERVLTDNAKNDTLSNAFADALHRIGARHKVTRPFRPQTNGKDVHLCQAASSARSGMNSVPALSIAQRTRSFVRARAMIA